MIRNAILMTSAAFVLASCAADQPPKAAAESASRLLAAAIARDRVAFEAQIDRPAVREDLRRQVADLARGKALDVEGGPSEFALDRMISPAAIRLVQAGSGESLSTAPTPAQVAPLMKAMDARHACLRDTSAPHHCLLTFARADGAWRLVGMQATGLRIELASR